MFERKCWTIERPWAWLKEVGSGLTKCGGNGRLNGSSIQLHTQRVACRALFCRICFRFISGLGECVSSNSQFFSRVERGPLSLCVLDVFLSYIFFSIFSIISWPSNMWDRVRSCWVLKSCLSRSTISSGTACVVIQREWVSKWVLTGMSPKEECDQDKTLSPTFPPPMASLSILSRDLMLNITWLTSTFCMRNQGEAGTLYVADEWKITLDVMASWPDFHIWVAAGQLALFENLTRYPLVLKVHTILIPTSFSRKMIKNTKMSIVARQLVDHQLSWLLIFVCLHPINKLENLLLYFHNLR